MTVLKTTLLLRILFLTAITITLCLITNARPAAAAVGDPFPSGAKLYVDAVGPAAQQAKAWRSSRPTEAASMTFLAKRPTARWLGDWTPNPQPAASQLASSARQAKAVAAVVAYNIPQRDCGSYSAGGAHSAAAYQQWISLLAAGLGKGPAAVILEPDAVAGWDCLSSEGQARRAQMLRQAVATLSQRRIAVYLDGGNANWQPASVMAARLRSSGIAQARGVAVNVSNFRSTKGSLSYVRALRRYLPGLHAVIDTSRNGLGPAANNEWCNPAGRALGASPTVSPKLAPLDALLWIKTPGESDGTCNGGPAAGVWWPEQALGLVKLALNPSLNG